MASLLYGYFSQVGVEGVVVEEVDEACCDEDGKGEETEEPEAVEEWSAGIGCQFINHCCFHNVFWLDEYVLEVKDGHKGWNTILSGTKKGAE